MFTLVIGGAASGKSEYAEAHVETLPGRRLYIATMEPWDEECRARIARHQAARAHKRFTTVECYRNLSQLTVPPDSNVLLECLGNLVANERYGRQGGGVAQAVAGVAHLLRQCRHVTVVTNEVYSSDLRCHKNQPYISSNDRHIVPTSNLGNTIFFKCSTI